MYRPQCATAVSLPCTPARAAPPVSLWVPVGLALGVAVALGFARFAYSLLLPAMRGDLHWSYAQAGSLGTAIAAGYLFGALLTTPVERALGTARVFVIGLGLTAASLMAMALFRDYAILLVLRFLAGLVTGWVFIAGFSLAAQAGAAGNRSTLFTAVYAAGAGLGMVLSGLLLPPVLASRWHWPGGWLALGLLSLLALLLAVPAVRRSPHPTATAARETTISWRGLRPILVAYLAYGAGYFALITFVIVYLHAAGYGPGRIADFWITAGLAAGVSMFLWGPLLAHLHGSRGVGVTTSVLIVSALNLLLLHGGVAVDISAVLFGGSLMASAFAHLDYARRLVPPQSWTRVIAAMTVMFSAGQTLGPLLCGWVADSAGLRAGMITAVALLLLGIAVASLQRGSTDGRPR